MAIRCKCGELRVSDVGQFVLLVGRIDQRFRLKSIPSNEPSLTLMVRDSSGSCRIIVKNIELIKKVSIMPLRSVVSINGQVKLRVEPNSLHRNGDIEVLAGRISNIV